MANKSFRRNIASYYDRNIGLKRPGVCLCKKSCSESSTPHRQFDYAPGKPFIGKNYGKDGHRKVLLIGINTVNREGEYLIDLQKFIEKQCFMKEPYWRRIVDYIRLLHRLSDMLTPEEVIDHVAATNSVKCMTKFHAVKNRACLPTKIMWENCRHHLINELKVLKPNLLITLGIEPWANLDKAELSTFLGKYQEIGYWLCQYPDCKVGPMKALSLYHPSRPRFHNENKRRIKKNLSKFFK